MHEIEHENQFSTQIKSNNSVLVRGNLPIYNPKPLLININYYEKLEENLSRNAQEKERKQSGDERTDSQGRHCVGFALKIKNERTLLGSSIKTVMGFKLYTNFIYTSIWTHS